MSDTEIYNGILNVLEKISQALEDVDSRVDDIDRRISPERSMESLLRQLCDLNDDISRLCRDMEKKIDQFTARDVMNSFSAITTDIENIISDAGVDIMVGPDVFNSNVQKIVEVIPTDNAEDNERISERLSPLYMAGDRVIIKEKVKVLKYAGAGSS